MGAPLSGIRADNILAGKEGIYNSNRKYYTLILSHYGNRLILRGIGLLYFMDLLVQGIILRVPLSLGLVLRLLNLLSVIKCIMFLT